MQREPSAMEPVTRQPSGVKRALSSIRWAVSTDLFSSWQWHLRCRPTMPAPSYAGEQQLLLCPQCKCRCFHMLAAEFGLVPETERHFHSPWQPLWRAAFQPAHQLQGQP